MSDPYEPIETYVFGDYLIYWIKPYRKKKKKLPVKFPYTMDYDEIPYEYINIEDILAEIGNEDFNFKEVDYVNRNRFGRNEHDKRKNRK